MKYLIILVFLFTRCSDDMSENSYIKSNVWQYEKGLKVGIGDFISFEGKNNNFELRDRTIYYLDKPCAIVKKVDSAYNELIIESLDSAFIGVYINTKEFLR